MPVRSDSVAGKVVEASRRRRALFRVTVPPGLARFLIAAGAQPAEPADGIQAVQSGQADGAPGSRPAPQDREAPSRSATRTAPAGGGSADIWHMSALGKIAVYLGLARHGDDPGPTDPDDHWEGAEGPHTAGLTTVRTVHPRSYDDARTVGELFREGNPVIMNLTEMADNDAKRIVDFAAGLIFGSRGSIERVSNKVFLLSPANVEVAAEMAATDVPPGEAAAARMAAEREVQT